MPPLPQPFFVLAPMDDVTDVVFRKLLAEVAKPDLFYTEFVNVDGLQSPGRPKLLHKLLISEDEKPIVAQLWGLNPDNFYKTTLEIADMGFSGVDLNMGCPVKTVVKNGACAALINNRHLAGEIIDATRQAAKEKAISFSVKTRVGYSNVDMSWPEYLLTKKLDMLTIHGRTAAQMSKVPADWSLIGNVRELRDQIAPDTLIVGNGDVESKDQGRELALKWQLDGVMVGRGIFHNPLLFNASESWEAWPARKKIDLFKKHIELHLKTYTSGERRFETLRKFCKVYINGFEGAHELRNEFMQTQNPEQALKLLESFNY